MSVKVINTRTSYRKARKKVLLPLLAALTGFVVSLCVLAIYSGHKPRGYTFLPEDASVTLAGQATPLRLLATYYQPRLLMPKGYEAPAPIVMWWEASTTSSDIILVYHAVWEDETHPQPLFHWLYRIYRALVYGIPVRDIEYIQINLSQRDGEISRLRYEDTSAKSYSDWIASHHLVTIERVGSRYQEVQTGQDRRSPLSRSISVGEVPLSFGIATWSHQLTLLEQPSAYYTVSVEFPLRYMTDDDYATYKLAWRSQGDLVTRESSFEKMLRVILAIMFMGIPFIILRIVQSRVRV